MSIDGYVDYRRREYCRAVACPIQARLDRQTSGTPEYDQVRGMCVNRCIHTTYEFHHWLIEQGYLVVRPGRE